MAPSQNEQRKIFTLLDLTKSLQSIIRKTYTGTYWIKAEIARLNFYPKSGHCYPDLVYKINGKVQAEMRSIIWKGDFRKLNKQFRDVVKEELKDGMQILFRATVNFHPKYSLSLNIVDIEPSFTLGEMAREKAETIDKLKKEGVYNNNKLLPFPLLPKKLAVISVSTSKGYHDFLNIIENNEYGFTIEHQLFSALLQGDKCAASVSGQLEEIRKMQSHFDAVAIIRGGGGDVGLNAYDDYTLAKEVATFPLPVISGIGHSTNATVVELVAHLNKITPTDVAYFFLNKFLDLFHHLNNLRENLHASAEKRIQGQQHILENRKQRILLHVHHFTTAQQKSLQNTNREIIREVHRRVIREQSKLRTYPESISRKVRQDLKTGRRELQTQSSSLHSLSLQHLKSNKKRIENIQTIIKILHPDNVLKRGYSISMKNGKAIKDVTGLQKGDVVTTKVYNGTFESEIKTKSS